MPRRPSFLEDFTIEGEWWLPETPDTRCHGVLAFGAHGVLLKLVNPLEDPSGRFEVIFGERNRTPVTVLHDLSDQEDNIYDTRRDHFYPGYLLNGFHLKSPREPQIKQILVNFTHLDKWLNVPTFETNDPWTVRMCEPPELNIDLPGFSLSLAYEIEMSGYVTHALKWTRTAYLKAEFEQLVALSQAVTVVEDLRALFGILTATGILPRIVRCGFLNDDLCTTYVYWPVSREAVGLRPLKLFLTYQDVKDFIDGIVRKWFSLKETLRPVYELLLSTFYDPRLYVHLQFLSLAQALETFHARTVESDQYLNDEDFKLVITQIIKSIPKTLPDNRQLPLGFLDGLPSKLKMINRYSLQRRIKELLNNVDSGIRALVAGDAAKLFAERVKDTRNYYTHWPVEPNGNPFTETELIRGVNRRLQLFVTVLILQELGVDHQLLARVAQEKFRNFGLRVVRELD